MNMRRIFFQASLPTLALVLLLGCNKSNSLHQNLTGKSGIPDFESDEASVLLKTLQTADESKALRDFALNIYGQQWVDQYIFANSIPELTPFEDDGNDDDGDGVVNRLDKCPQTMSGKKWTYGEWIGCAEEEERS